MHPVRSTYKVLADRATHSDRGEDWVDWAIEMMEGGFDSEHLYILAGLTPPFNTFELVDLVKRTLVELQIDIPPKFEAVFGYAYFLVCEALDNKISFYAALAELKDLCLTLDMSAELMDFYLMFYAYDDIRDHGEQFYWAGATLDNIETIAREAFVTWKNRYEFRP